MSIGCRIVLFSSFKGRLPTVTCRISSKLLWQLQVVRLAWSISYLAGNSQLLLVFRDCNHWAFVSWPWRRWRLVRRSCGKRSPRRLVRQSIIRRPNSLVCWMSCDRWMNKPAVNVHGATKQNWNFLVLMEKGKTDGYWNLSISFEIGKIGPENWDKVAVLHLQGEAIKSH